VNTVIKLHGQNRKTLAEAYGVSPKTLTKWVKHLLVEFDCEKNRVLPPKTVEAIIVFLGSPE